MASIDFVISGVLYLSTGAVAAIFYFRLHPRVAGTELLVPISVLYAWIVLSSLALFSTCMAVVQGDVPLAGQFLRAEASTIGLPTTAFLHLISKFPRYLTAPWVRLAIEANYVLAGVQIVLFETDLATTTGVGLAGGPIIINGPLALALSGVVGLSLFSGLIYLVFLGVRGRTETERNSARGLLFAATVPILFSIPYFEFGVPRAPPFDPTMVGTAWWVVAVFAVVSAGRLQFRVPPTLESVLNSVYDAILVADREQRVFYANRACERLLGARSQQTVATPFSEVVGGASRDAQGSSLLLAAMEEVLSGHRSSYTLELRALGPQARTCRVDLVPLGEGGAGSVPSAVLVVFSDQTERVALEESNARVRQLQDLVIRVLGHDLKAPIAVVQGTVELTEMRLVKLPPEEELVEIRTGLRRIREATISMLVVLENARAVSRLTTQEIGVVKLEEKDLSAMTSRTVAMLQPAAAGRHLKVEASIQPDVRARVLPGFESVVQNLLDNAIKYTPRGGTVGVRLFTDGSHVGIEVWDTGPGIPPEKRDKLFRKFERLGVEGGLTEGHGLGLSIVSKMVELAGGTVSVSDKGDGSPGAVFMVELPLAGSADSSLPAGSGAAPSGMARPLLR